MYFRATRALLMMIKLWFMLICALKAKPPAADEWMMGSSTAAELRPVVSERQTAQCVFTQTRQSPLLLQTTVGSTNSLVWQKSCTAVNTLCAHRPLPRLLAEGEHKKQTSYIYITVQCVSKDIFQLTSAYKRNISSSAQYSWKVSIFWHFSSSERGFSIINTLRLQSVFEQSFSPVEVFQTHAALRHSHSLRLPASDVRLRQVPVHLWSGQEEAFLPAAATLPGQQTGSGFVPQQDDQSHLQTLPEETVHEECRLWVTSFKSRLNDFII